MSSKRSNSADHIALQVLLPVRVSVISFGIALVLDVLYYYFSRSATETLVFAAATTASAGAILAAFYTGRAIGLQIEAGKAADTQRERQYQLEKKKFALSLAARWNSPAMRACRRTCRGVVNMKTHGLEQIREAADKDNNIDDIIHLLNFLEEVAIAGAEEVADEELLRDFFGEIIAQAWKTLELWINHYRDTRGAPEIWGGLEDIHVKWRASV